MQLLLMLLSHTTNDVREIVKWGGSVPPDIKVGGLQPGQSLLFVLFYFAGSSAVGYDTKCSKG